MMFAYLRPPLALGLGLILAGAPLAARHAITPRHNPGYSSANQPVVSAAGAVVPNCPNWSSGGRDSASLTDSNFGCAVNSNLAAMVADPGDLLHGKSDGFTDGSTAARSIKAWREVEPTSKLWASTVKETTKGGGAQ